MLCRSAADSLIIFIINTERHVIIDVRTGWSWVWFQNESWLLCSHKRWFNVTEMSLYWPPSDIKLIGLDLMLRKGVQKFSVLFWVQTRIVKVMFCFISWVYQIIGQPATVHIICFKTANHWDVVVKIVDTRTHLDHGADTWDNDVATFNILQLSWAWRHTTLKARVSQQICFFTVTLQAKSVNILSILIFLQQWKARHFKYFNREGYNFCWHFNVFNRHLEISFLSLPFM